MDEQDYLQNAIAGDKAAITHLLMQYRELVASVVSRLVYEPENRKDVIQSVFMQAIKGITCFDGNCRFSTWLYRLTVNQSIDYNRKKLRMSTVSHIVDWNTVPSKNSGNDGFEFIAKKELARIIGEELDKIPLDQKAAFNLFYFCGHSGKEGAEIMKITEDNFYMKLKIARDRVRKALKNKGWTE